MQRFLSNPPSRQIAPGRLLDRPVEPPVPRSAEPSAFHRKVEIYLGRSGMAPTSFGRMASGDPNLVRDLRNGRSPDSDVIDRVENFLNMIVLHGGVIHA